MTEENNKNTQSGRCSECRKRLYCKTQCRANKELIEKEAQAMLWRMTFRGFNDLKHE